MCAGMAEKDPIPRPPPVLMRGTHIVRRLAVIGCLASFVYVTTHLAYYSLFTYHHTRDDEGYILVSLKEFFAGKALYGEVYSQYGPFFFFFKSILSLLTGMEVSHESTRLTTLVIWLLSAMVCGLIVYRISRSIVLAAFTYLLTFYTTTTMLSEPGHPHELTVLLAAGAIAVSFVHDARRTSRWGAVLAGGFLAALFLTKINVGVFLIWAFAIIFLSFGPRHGLLKLLRILLSLFAVLLPIILMRKHLGSFQDLQFAACSGLSILLVLLMLWKTDLHGRIPMHGLFRLGIGFLLVSVTTLTYIIFQGTSLVALFDGIVLRSLRFSGTFHIPGSEPLLGTYSVTVICLSAAALFLATHFARKNSAYRIMTGLVLKILFFVLVLCVCVSSSKGKTFYYPLPFLWVVLISPLPEIRNAVLLSSARITLCLVAAMHTLVVYPVAGSQVHWAFFLYIPASSIALWDVVHWGLTRIERIRPWSTILKRRRTCCVATLIIMLAFIISTQPSPSLIAKEHQKLIQLNMKGAESIRALPFEAGICHWVVTNLRAYADTYYSFPGFNSFYLWAEQEPPTALNTTNWMALFDEAMQKEVIRSLEAHDRLAILVNTPVAKSWLKFSRTTNCPLIEYIDQRFTTVFRAGGFQFKVRNEYATEAKQEYLLYKEWEPAHDHDVIPLPHNILSNRRPLSLSGWFKTSKGGVLIGRQKSLPFESEPDQASPVVYIGTDGLLRAQLHPDTSEPITARVKVDDDRWHHFVITAAAGRQRLFIDGKKAGRGELPDTQVSIQPVVQIGSGYTNGWPEASNGWNSYKGMIKNVTIKHRVITNENVKALYRQGLSEL